MKALAFYRLLTFLLVPVATILGVLDLLGLLAALSNPPLLLGVFMLACAVIYIFASLSFLNKGIDGNRFCKPSLRDWIRVNAFVSIGFAVLSLIQCVALLFDPTLFKQVADQAAAQQGNMPGTVTPEFVERILKGIMYFIVAFCVLLLVHIVIGLKLLKSYRHVFEGEEAH